MTTRWSDDDVAAIAADADADPRSVTRRLAGLPVRGRAGRRIDAAIARRDPQTTAPRGPGGATYITGAETSHAETESITQDAA